MDKGGARAFAEIIVLVFVVLTGFFYVVRAVPGSKPLAPAAMFIFGDSLIDDGNNNYLPTIARANYLPYGIDFGSPTGRFCNGQTVVDYGARTLGLPLIPPSLSPTSTGKNLLHGLNYASAAGGILEETGRTYGGRVSLSCQVSLFEKTVGVDLPPLFQSPEYLTRYLAKSIFVINIGSNDYINNYLLPRDYPTRQVLNGDQYADLLISTYSQQISRLYGLGARKILLTGLGTLGCIPSQLSRVNSTDGCVEWVNSLAKMFNHRLLHLSKMLNASLPGTYFVFHDTYNLFHNLINNPHRYGFTVANKACCGHGKNGGTLTCLPFQAPCHNRDQFVFWDSFHPTQAANAIIANRCYSPHSRDCYPISISELAQI